MNVNELKKSNFLKKEDVGRGALVTISDVRQENIAKEGAPEEMKWCLYLKEFEKPMVLNSTNGQLIAKITGSDESDHWAGVKVVLYDDPSITFGGKLTGGIRVRAPRNQPPAAPAAPTVVGRPVAGHVAPKVQPRTEELAPGPIDEEDVPF